VGNNSGNKLDFASPLEARKMSALIDQGPAKIPKTEEASSSYKHSVDLLESTQQIRPVIYMWPWSKKDGHEMVSIKFSPNAGMSPDTDDGIEIHAVGSFCYITCDWPRKFIAPDPSTYYKDVELQDEDIQRMVTAERDFLRKALLAHADEILRTTMVITVPFPVIETRNPPMKLVAIDKCGTCWLTIWLASTIVPNFVARKSVKETRFEE
jgi:hypothetical protein